MSIELPEVYLMRHGETAWAASGQHTGLKDIPLTEAGIEEARRLQPRLAGIHFDAVLTSPLQRARKTCELAGFGQQAIVEPLAVEWNYGDYEGRTLAEIRQTRPDWHVFDDGCPGGESVAEITARADRMVAKLRTMSGRTAIFSHGHFCRVLAARWCGLDITFAKYLLLNTGAVCVLAYDRQLDQPAIRSWNVHH
ncbi:histidine phosphatase family protein [Planctomicrobium piriforme]|uniref:Probable phosphoglycerate mutase n=1 Tax=Planctomicrobium piriforme TaxID=1576369 RepID=A0A1I3RPJ3_9PLAN|nr:histidine phosphatase family protein [Planctomicrobium piriforme]SFJ47106.1 probable phosphoglycerate mutase [Planctomicrobium piriforme]